MPTPPGAVCTFRAPEIQGARITVFNLDTLEPVGEIQETSARGAAADPKSNHGFVTSKPVVMFDTKTLAVVKKIDVEGGPDGIFSTISTSAPTSGAIARRTQP